ncbi:PREDICTED: cathepsin O-like isoform X2 [Ceratosolen solmsi marchali]|uniref:Cathepsin O-like isoform X2 n=1 Tax=Ceratosolen solmsi marchali TaxID=326594 RepID=A0AAJ6YCR4_9HYME|nr:PREDICTED: cathepsin O-like isoform X2 [Ceratosolen solmsi marchali]
MELARANAMKIIMALTIVAVSLCLLIIPISVEPDRSQDIKLFEAYVTEYKKPYKFNRTEYERRFERFQRSLRKIDALNGLRMSEHSARYGVTEYSDMTEQEFLALNLHPDLPAHSERHHQCHYHHIHSAKRSRRASLILPMKHDWREKGVVTAIKSQGNCGACWAFSVVEVAESMFAISNKTLSALSIQEMIDCAGNNNFGCEGGDICSLLEWLVISKTRILPEANYPLTRITNVCKLQKKNVESQVGIQVSDFTCDNFVNAEEELLKELVTKGPVAAAVNALSWQNYLGGIIQFHCDGSFANLNHAVQIVGYDKTAEIPYYIVRNSWGSSFGDKGYLYIAIGNNLCGIANQVSAVDVVY